MTLIDFDGTIVDLWPRYHAVFSDLTKCKIDLEEYKILKQTLKKDECIANFLNIKLPSDYFSMKSICLEDCYYLRQDTLLLPKETLIHFFKQQNSVILTRRRNTTNFRWELAHLGLLDLQVNSICVNNSKLEWTTENIKEKTTIIGDDIHDLQVAKLPFVNATMVLSGLGTQKDFDKLNIVHTTFKTLDAYIHNHLS